MHPALLLHPKWGTILLDRLAVSGQRVDEPVQPVARQFNRPLLPSQTSKERPVLLEVTVPYTTVFRRPDAESPRVYRLYYATTHWATAVERDEKRQSWYKLRNDRGRGHYYARAEHLRPFSPAELSPISPGVPNKHIDINLTDQTLTAYEGDEVALATRVATGAVFTANTLGAGAKLTIVAATAMFSIYTVATGSEPAIVTAGMYTVYSIGTAIAVYAIIRGSKYAGIAATGMFTIYTTVNIATGIDTAGITAFNPEFKVSRAICPDADLAIGKD